MHVDLSGKVAVVTGGSSGIGLATAALLSQCGATVYVTGRRRAALDQARQIVGDGLRTVPGDVADLDDLDRLVATLRAEQDGVDVLVACAGVSRSSPLAETTPELFDETFGINARGTYFTVQRMLPVLNEGASVTLLSSAMAGRGTAGFTVYAATKAAIRSFALTMSTELAPRRIRVNTVSPGVIDTPILEAQFTTRELHREAMNKFGELVKLQRVGQAEEVAVGIVFLASDAGSYTNGIDLVIDGGR